MIASVVVLALLTAYLGGVGTAWANGPDEDVPGQGAPPKGIAVKVFIRQAKEGGKPQDVDLASAGLATDPNYNYGGIR